MFRLLTVAASAIVVGCGGDSTGYGVNPPPAPPPPPPAGGRLTTITVDNNKFTPTPDTMAAGTVTFTWAAGAITHNVTWVTGPTSPAGSGNRSAGSADYTALVVQGTYTFHCSLHGGMNGTLVVE